MKMKVQVVIIEKNKNGLELIELKVNAMRGGFWQNVTGSVEKGESYEEAARRELFEETGLTLGPLVDLNDEIFFTDRHGRDVSEKSFLAFIPSPRLIKFSSEHTHLRKIKIEAVSRDHFKFLTNFEAFKKAQIKVQSFV